jgi:hypothetical protein
MLFTRLVIPVGYLVLEENRQGSSRTDGPSLHAPSSLAPLPKTLLPEGEIA